MKILFEIVSTEIIKKLNGGYPNITVTFESRDITMQEKITLEGDDNVNVPLYPVLQPIGNVGGDPYITPRYGPEVKLPNCDNYYRLLQIPSTQTIINAAVSRATPEQQSAIRDQTTKIIDYADDGYFLSQIFVSTGGHDNITINLEPGMDVLSRTDLPWAERSRCAHRSTYNGAFARDVPSPECPGWSRDVGGPHLCQCPDPQ
jgi:hypothetical protein